MTLITYDLDSTLCDTRHRHRLIDRINGTDWDAYSKACVDDVVIEGALALLKILKADPNNQIHFVTGRTEAARPETQAWLEKHFPDYDGLWMDDTPGGDHFAVYGGHAEYKVARVQHVADHVGEPVAFHVDDWAEVAVALGKAGVPTMCVRTPSEVEDLVNPRFDNPSMLL